MRERWNSKARIGARIIWVLGMAIGMGYFAVNIVGIGTTHANSTIPHTSYSVTDCSAFGGAPTPTPLPTVTPSLTPTPSGSPGSLQYALNVAGSGDTINFNCSGSGSATIIVPSTIAITNNLTLQRQSGQSIILSGSNTVQVFSVASNVTLTLNNLTITAGAGSSSFQSSIARGLSPHGRTIPPATTQGGAIYNNGGTVNSTGVTYLSNSATGAGGAIYNNGGTVNSTGDSFIQNSAASGGAIYSAGGTATITNALFSANTATTSGGAITNDGSYVNVTGSTFTGNTAVNGGAIYLTNNVAHGTILNSTFTNNSVTVSTNVAGGGAIEVAQGILAVVANTIAGNSITAQSNTYYARGAGIYDQGGTVSVLSSILVGNVVNYTSNGPQQYGNNCSGTISDRGYNIESSTDCEFTKGENTSTPDQQNVTNAQLKLGALANNGGATPTMGLGNGSVAINRGAPTGDANCPGTDQRGFGRAYRCDVGAFEFRAPVLHNVPGNMTVDIATGPSVSGNITSTTVSWANPTGTLPDSSDAASVSCSPASGSVFYIGTTVVTCTATDAANPATPTSASFTVLVKNSNNVPTLSMPPTIYAQATSANGANVTYSVTAQDTAYPSSQVTVTCVKHGDNTSVPSGTNVSANFAMGVTQVDCTATNPNGKIDSQSFSVVVTDYATVNVPKTITVPATSAQGSAVSFTVSAIDPVYPASQLTIRCNPDSGSVFAIGTNQVTCTATNPLNNSNSATFNVVVQDIPQISPPEGDVTVDATSAQGTSIDLSRYVTASNQFLATAPSISCWLDSDPNKTNIYPSGEGQNQLPVFPITMQGNGTLVDCQATNQAGFSSNVVSFNVKVRDTLPPTINVSNSVTVNATTPNGAVVNYSVIASDPVYPSGALTMTCWNDANNNILYPTGFSVSATFPIGTTQVDCRVSNPSGGQATSNFTVTVVDKLQPTLSLPSTITVNAANGQGATVTYTVSASDPIFPANQLTVTCSPSSGSTFPLGTTTVHCSAANPLGTTVYGSFKVIVQGSAKLPTLSLPSTITVGASSANGATVTYSVTASDPVYPSNQLTVTCWNDANGNVTYPTGQSVHATFPIGTTQVDCRASNPGGGAVTGNFTVIVKKLSPTLTLPSMITVNATSPQGAVVTYDYTAADPVFPANQLTASCAPASGGTFPIGTTTVYCSVTNPLNVTVSGSFRVRVRDAGDQIADMMRDLDNLHLQRNVYSQLYNQLYKALSAFNSNRYNTGRVRDLLNSFISMVQNLRNNGLTSSQADQLIATARQIQTVLGG